MNPLGVLVRLVVGTLVLAAGVASTAGGAEIESRCPTALETKYWALRREVKRLEVAREDATRETFVLSFKQPTDSAAWREAEERRKRLGHEIVAAWTKFRTSTPGHFDCNVQRPTGGEFRINSEHVDEYVNILRNAMARD